MWKSPLQLGPLVVWLGCALVLCHTGCSKSPSTPATVTSDDESTDLLKQVSKRYRWATSYSDRGHIAWQMGSGEHAPTGNADFAIAYNAPNQLRVELPGLLIVRDGTTFQTQLDGDLLANFDYQGVRREETDQVLRLRALSSDEHIQRMIAQLAGGHPVSLRLLLDPRGLESLLEEESETTLLAPEHIEGKMFQRVEVDAAAASIIFWIDEEKLVFRRIEFHGKRPESGDDATVPILKVVTNLLDVNIDVEVAGDRFQIKERPGDVITDHFVQPPPPLPTPLYGKQVGDFSFETLEGVSVTRSSLGGRVAVLVWFSEQSYSRVALEQVAALQAKYANRKDVTFLAIAAPGKNVPQKLLQELLKSWKVAVPVARDPQSNGKSVFGVSVAPTIVVLDKKSRMQAFEIGGNPHLANELSIRIDKLVDGVDVAAGELRWHRTQQRNYERTLASAGSGQASQVIALPQTKIAPASLPEQLLLNELWKTDEIKAPGNILVVDDAENKPRIFVLDGWSTVVELTPEGKVVKRFPLGLPQDVGITHLQTAVDGDGNRFFLGSAVLGKQAVLFNDKFQIVTSYPDAKQTHEGIGDVVIADLSLDGDLEMGVGFWGVIGVHGVYLSGRRSWSNREQESVFSIAVSHPDDRNRRRFLICNTSGNIHVIDRSGLSRPVVEIRGKSINRLVTSKFVPNEASAYCGLSYQGKGRVELFAFDLQLGELWSYDLPSGAYNTSVRPLTSGTMLSGRGYWIVVGPDGSLHLLADDGSFVDYFHVGKAITGVELASIGDKDVLLIATDGSIVAKQVRLKK